MKVKRLNHTHLYDKINGVYLEWDTGGDPRVVGADIYHGT
jgi:hypothetical protein